jgi:outer membrane biosynthesis protein TonB
VFHIAAAPDRDRREPTLTGAPRLVSPDPSRLAPPERLTPIAARERARWLGPITSLVLHLLPLLLLIEWPMAAPPVVQPIAVQLVFEPPPPPPPPPSPLPPKPEFKPPPPGRIASEDLGDTEIKEASREKSEPPAAKDTSPPPPPEKAEAPPAPPEQVETPPPEPSQQTAAIVPPPPEKPAPPKPQLKPKPNPTTQPLLRREEEPAHTTARRAKYPGPAATRDEYLAYVHSLIRQHYNMLPLAMVGGRRGETQVEFMVLDDGTIGAIRLRQSSGWQDIDARVELMIAAVRRVPPLPQWFQGPSMGLVLNLPFPDALRE